MRQVAILVDSSASMPSDIAHKYEVSIIPVSIQRGTHTYKDGRDLSYEEFYRMLAEEPALKTSQPSPGEFAQTYIRLAQTAKSIISLHVTRKASGTCQSAALARDALPEIDIDIVDSGTTSMALGFIAIAAATAARLGRSRHQILETIEEAKNRVSIYVAIPGLGELRRSGKIGLGQSLIGSMLSVKPILTMRGGMLEVCERVRSYPRALDRVADLIVTAAGKSQVKLAVLYSKTREEALRFSTRLQESLRCSEVIIAEIGAALAVHGGPGMIGAAIYRE